MRPLALAALLLPALASSSLVGVAAAQSPVVIALRDGRPAPDAPFSVARVVDLRADTAAIGEARVGLLNKRRPVQIEGGVAGALGAYLGAALPVGDGREPLVVGVDALEVSEQMTAVTEFGRAEVQLRLFRETEGGLAEVGRAQALVEGSGVDVTRGHAGRLADALDRAAAELSALDPASAAPAAPFALAPGSPLPTPVASLTAAAERSFRTFVTGGPVVGGNATGGRIAYGIRSVGGGAWSVPLTLEASVVKTQNARAGVEGVFATYGGTVQAARRLGASNVYLQPGLQISGGNEQLYGDQNFFFGGRLSADLVRYPADRGLIVGVGVYGSRLFGSEVYPRDAGVALTVGGQF